ncbi:MAG: exosome complex RNA-binding protein Csl4 [Candidatus Thorarchaeota archaeon]|jgi:putative methylase
MDYINDFIGIQIIMVFVDVNELRLRDLEIKLQSMNRLTEYEVSLEQYPTPAKIAATILFAAQMEHGDVSDRIVCDLGCGDGIFAIGAALLGAKRVIGIDVQSKALKAAQRNSSMLGTEDAIDLVLGEVSFLNFRESIDTVVSNPPFGVQKRGADLSFLRKALSIAGVTYSIHLSGEKNRNFLQESIKDLGGTVTQIETFEFPIRKMFKFHRKEKHLTKVDLYRICIVYAATMGSVAMDLKDRSISVVSPDGTLKLALPVRGDILVGEVINSYEQRAEIHIAKRNGVDVLSTIVGEIRISNVTRRYVKSMHDVLRPGDIIRAVAMNTHEIPVELSLVGPELGVLFSKCVKCGNSLTLTTYNNMVCTRCENRETREVAKDYGAAFGLETRPDLAPRRRQYEDRRYGDDRRGDRRYGDRRSRGGGGRRYDDRRGGGRGGPRRGDRRR